MLLTVMADLRRRHPGIEVRMRSSNGAGLHKLLIEGSIELAFSHERTCADEIEFLPLYRSRRLIVAPARHPVLSARRLTAGVLAQYPIILPERGSRTARELLARLSPAARKRSLQIPIEVMGAETRALCVQEGWGIAVVEEGHPPVRVRGLKSRPIPEEILPARAVGVYAMKGRLLSRGARAFLQICSSQGWNMAHAT